MHGKTPCIEL